MVLFLDDLKSNAALLCFRVQCKQLTITVTTSPFTFCAIKLSDTQDKSNKSDLGRINRHGYSMRNQLCAVVETAYKHSNMSRCKLKYNTGHEYDYSKRTF